MKLFSAGKKVFQKRWWIVLKCHMPDFHRGGRCSSIQQHFVGCWIWTNWLVFNTRESCSVVVWSGTVQWIFSLCSKSRVRVGVYSELWLEQSRCRGTDTVSLFQLQTAGTVPFYQQVFGVSSRLLQSRFTLLKAYSQQMPRRVSAGSLSSALLHHNNPGA